jgi:hypothetical protein
MLVLIDGEPKLQLNKDINMDIVVNSPFTIVKTSMDVFISTEEAVVCCKRSHRTL